MKLSELSDDWRIPFPLSPNPKSCRRSAVKLTACGLVVVTVSIVIYILMIAKKIRVYVPWKDNSILTIPLQMVFAAFSAGRLVYQMIMVFKRCLQ